MTLSEIRYFLNNTMHSHFIVLSPCGTEALLWYLFNFYSNKTNNYAMIKESFTLIRAYDTQTTIDLRQYSILGFKCILLESGLFLCVFDI